MIQGKYTNACGLFLDTSRHCITDREFIKLCRDKEAKQLRKVDQDIVNGAYLNVSENRQALHASLRSFSASSPKYEKVNREQMRFLEFSSCVRNGDCVDVADISLPMLSISG